MSDVPPASPDFEASLEELQSIVHELEEGRIGLEPSLARFEEGVRLLRSCFQFLEQAEQRITLLTGIDADGNPVTAPFDATATIDKSDKSIAKPGRRRGPAKAAPEPEPQVADDSDEQRLF